MLVISSLIGRASRTFFFPYVFITMGLAEVKNRQKFGLDPRNTTWSNNTDRFGHQYLAKMGWAPGKGLGLVDHATVSHVKVLFKQDNQGLGAKLSKKTKKDEFDSGECAGLDVFQRILGRLNGKGDKVGDELDRQMKERVLNGKWGMHFVKGEVLRSTWDLEAKKLMAEQKPVPESKKRKTDDDSEEIKLKRAKKEKSERRVKKDKKDKKDKKEKKEKSEKSEKSEKKDKKEKKDRKTKIDEDEKTKEADGSDKKLKKSKVTKKEKTKDRKSKSKKEKSPVDASSEVTRDTMLKPREQSPVPISTRLAVRAKWIRQKKASVMDAKALNEIFMVTN